MIRIEERKNQQAKMVLETFKWLAEGSDLDVELELKDFDNCREQGYVLQLQYLNGKYIMDNCNVIHFAFAESRNSDSIVVYQDTGCYESASYCSDNFWHSSHSFECGQALQAAKYILNELVEHVQLINKKGHKNEEV